MKKKLIAAISVGICAAVTAGILVFNSAGGENQVGSGWYLKNGEAFSEAVYVNENSRSAPSQVFGDEYMLDDGSYLNTETGEYYVYVGEKIPALNTGKFYLDGNTNNPYFEVYPDGTLQKHNFDIEGDLWAIQGDLSDATEENLNSMAELINEEAAFERSRLYYGIKAIYEDAVVIMLNTENDFSQDFYRCYTYESSDEFTDGIGRHFIRVQE